MNSVERFAAWIPTPAEQAADRKRMDEMLDLLMFGLGQDLLPPPTEAQLTEGYATYPHHDHEHTIEVGWRAEKTRADAEAKREAEMAACPYVACECGHHETSDW